MYLGTNYMPPVIHPTNFNVNHTFSTTVVPHIHPTHTTTVNHHLYQHKHYCPQSYSCANEVSNQQYNCCGGSMPSAAPGMMPSAAPGMMPPAAPGMMPPAGPGFGPGTY